MTGRSPTRNDAELAGLLRAWLREGVTELPDGGVLPAAVRDDVLRRLDDTPQHRRRWLGRWLDGLRGATRNARDNDTTRRNRTMFAATAAAGVATLTLAAILIIPGLGQPNPAPAAQGSPSPPATAAVPTPAAPVWAAVSGASTCSEPTGGQEHLASAPYTASGFIFSCTNTATDPRVAGPSTMTFSVQTWDDRVKASGGGVIYNGTAWLHYVTSGPDGTWTGDGYGFYDNDALLRIVAIQAGSGAYEGLIFTWSGTVAVNSLTANFVGVIQPGSPPPDFPVGAETFPTGKWTATSGSDVGFMEFRPDGTWTFTGNGAVVSAGTYATDKGTLTFMTDTVCDPQNTGPGTYSWTHTANQLTLKMQKDACSDRAGVMDGRVWTAVP